MNNQSIPSQSMNPADNQIIIEEIMECVKRRMEAYGLENAMHHFDSMDLLMCRHPLWHHVKENIGIMFAERRMETELNKPMELVNPTIHQKMENCQVFNGPISGCVFAMPGSHVTQQAEKSVHQEMEKQETPHLDCEGDFADTSFLIHPAVPRIQERQVQEEIKRLVSRQGIQDICLFLLRLRDEKKVLLPQNAERAYKELVRLGMPKCEGYALKTFMKYYKR